jgi:multicomponent Na+:H+ antiporter subunit B
LKKTGLIIAILLGVLLIYDTSDFPNLGDPMSPASLHVSPYYIENAIHDTDVPNIVTAVLADYRGYDTMFETTVIFCAGIACFFLLRITRRREPSVSLYRHLPTGITLRIEKGGKEPEESKIFKRIDAQWVPDDMIIKLTCRMVIPFIQLFALYVIFHGHHSPGGGFQGGVILGASIILFAISTDLRTSINRMSEKAGAFFSATGVFIYAGTGALCLVLGKRFLDYSALAPVLNVSSALARSHGILIVEVGVGLAVMAVMIGIYYNLSSAGRHDEGL